MPRSRPSSGSRSSPACATGSRGSPTRSSRRWPAEPTRSSASCWRRTTRRCRSSATARSSSMPSPTAPRSASSSAGATSPASSTCSPSACRRHRRPRRLHGPLAAGADPRRGRPVQGRAARDVPSRRREGRRRGVVVLVPERVADGRALARPGHPRAPRTRSPRTASATCSSRRSASSPTTSRSGGTSTSRRRSARRSSASELDRIELPNAEPAFVRVLAGLVRRAAGCTVCSA